MHLIKRLFFYSLLVILAGCGFQLRGHVKLPPQLTRIALQTDTAYGLLAQQLKLTLIKAGVKVVANTENAPITLKLFKDSFNQLSTAAGATNQLVTYTLNYNLQYALLDAAKKPILEPRTITISRSFAANNNQLLGSSNEQNLLQQDMRREAVMQIFSQLTSKQVLTAINAASQ